MSPTPYTSFGGQELGRTTTWADEGKAGTQAAGDLPRRRLKERQELGIGEDSWKREGTVLAYRQKRLINRTAEFKYIRVSHRLVRCLKNDTTASFPLFAISLESVPAIYMWSLFFLQISSQKDDKLSALRKNLNTNLFSRDGDKGSLVGIFTFHGVALHIWPPVTGLNTTQQRAPKPTPVSLKARQDFLQDLPKEFL